MSDKNNEVPEDPDEFLEWMRETSRPIYGKPKAPVSDSTKVKNAEKKYGKTADELDIDKINLNIIDMDDDDSWATSMIDAATIKADTPSALEDATGPTEKVQSLSSKSDESSAGDVEPMKNGTPDSPAPSDKVTDMTIVTDTVIVNEMSDTCIEDVNDNLPQAAERDMSQKEAPSPSTARPTRISAKMRKATRTEFCEAYTGKFDTKKGKPISIAPSIMERLYWLCSLTGDRNACPTYVINNLLLEFLDAVEPEARKWGALS